MLDPNRTRMRDIEGNSGRKIFLKILHWYACIDRSHFTLMNKFCVNMLIDNNSIALYLREMSISKNFMKQFAEIFLKYKTE